MKKVVSLLIVVAMIISAVAVCILPAAAAGGDFYVSIKKEELYLDEEDQKSVPGYIFTDDGMSVNPMGEGYEEYRATWPNNTPYYSIQTANEESLMGGFYMEVRIDAFTIAKADKWLGFSVWDSHGLQLGQVGTDNEGREFGNGVETLIRLNEDTNHAKSLHWFDDTEMLESGRRSVRDDKNSNQYPSMYKEDENGYQLVTLEIQYDPDDTGWYSYKINDVEAPDDFRESLTLWLQDRGDKAYVGFSLQSAIMNGDASVTITKIGESKETASAPIGYEEDWVKAIQRDNAVAPIVPKDEADLEEGAPAIWVTAGDTDSYKSYTSLAGNVNITITEDGNFKFVLPNSDCADPVIRIPNTVSYDATDFPIGFIVVKNYCTCKYEDQNHNGHIDEFDMVCTDQEMISMFYHAGPHPDGVDTRTIYTKLTDLTTTDADGNVYSVFWCDLTDDIAKEEGPQRIHGFMPRFNYIKYQEIGRNEFEVISFAYFASVEDGEAYIANYFEENLDMEADTEDTDTDESTDTDAPDQTESTEIPAGPDIPDPDSELSIKDAVDLAIALGQGIYTNGNYYINGVTVSEVIDNVTGAMNVVDADGNVLCITATFDVDGVTAYGDMVYRPEKGDVVYLYGVIGNNGKPCMKDAMITYFEEGEQDTEAPVTTEPTTPDTTEPATPDTTEPATPDTTEPTTPDTTESTTPDTTESTTPDTTESTTPDTTESTTPDTTEPTTPDTTEPATPDTTEPATPDTTEPATPDTTEPATPDTTEPATPDTTEPATPDTTEPATPDTTEPTTPNTTEPTTPDTTEPVSKPAQTEPKDEPTTEAPKTEVPNRGGCGSVAGFGAIAIVAVAAIGLVSFKKKED